jgi:hypothetical protein
MGYWAKEKQREYDKTPKRLAAHRLRARQYYYNHKEEHIKYQRKYNYKRQYGITLEQYNELFNNQKGLCLGCYRHQSQLSKRLAVDHDHKSGKIRGLLCFRCNSSLGRTLESPETLRRLADYLERNAAPEALNAKLD